MSDKTDEDKKIERLIIHKNLTVTGGWGIIRTLIDWGR